MKKLFGLALLLLLTVNSAYSEDMRFVQVDSLCFSASNEKSVQKLDELINDINKQKNTEFVIFTGNNIAKPNKDDLSEFLAAAKKLNFPFYVVIGNKDVNKQKDLSKKEYMRILSKKARSHRKIDSPNYVIEKKDVVFIIADGAKDVIPSSTGYYKADVMRWLDEQLNLYKNKNVVIVQHFPIIPPSNRESHYTYKADEYLKLLAKHKNVKAVVSGHFNKNSEKEVNKILHITTADAPEYRIIDILDCDTSSPSFWSTIREP